MKLFKKLFPSKEKKLYLKMHRRHRKELIKLAKKDAEWDYGFLHTLIITKIRHMYEYYSLGNNVWQTDETRLPIVDELKHVLDLQKKLDDLWKEPYVGVERYHQRLKREHNLYKEIYKYIGANLQKWWD